MSFRGLLALSLLLGLRPADQPPGIVRLGSPDAVLPFEFSQIRGVVERPDGRLVISDRLAELVVVADLSTGKVIPIGRAGSGPAEYRLPAALIPASGDSILVIDEGNDRIVVIGPDDRIRRSFRSRTPTLPHSLRPRAVDAEGRFYAVVPGWLLNAGAPGPGPDSLPLMRFVDGGSGLERIASLRAAPEPPAPPRRDRPRIPMVVFGGGDSWAASLDGRVGIVRAADYRIEWIEPDGGRTIGPRTPWSRVPVTAADRLAYARTFLANSGVGGKGGPGGAPTGLSAVPPEMQTAEQIEALAGNTAFATTKPPFTDAAPRIAPDGKLWVERSVPFGAASVWDIFDRRGALALRVQLPEGRRLAALGRRALYLVGVDGDGLERLERYRLPPGP